LLDIVGRDSPQIVGLDVAELGGPTTSNSAVENFLAMEEENGGSHSQADLVLDAFEPSPILANKVTTHLLNNIT